MSFDMMELWVRILNLPLGWMNAHRGERDMALVGSVVKMDVDKGASQAAPFYELGLPLISINHYVGGAFADR